MATRAFLSFSRRKRGSCFMTVHQPFEYQGSKRALAALILQYF
jgi:hypothetical protein